MALWFVARLIEGIRYDELLVRSSSPRSCSATVNLFVRPLLILLTLPAVILTLGLALLFINALMLLLTAWIVPDFDVQDFFWWASSGRLDRSGS